MAKTRSFGQFDGGKGTEAAKKRTPAKKTPSRPADSRNSAAQRSPRAPSAEDKLRSDAKAHRSAVLRGGN